jgi:hypothetical protein
MDRAHLDTPPLVPPLLPGRDLAERRQLWSKHLERKSRSALLTDTVTGKPIAGSPCPRCGRSVEIMARLSVSDRELSRRSFMLVWQYCAHDRLVIYPQEFRHWNVEPNDEEIAMMLTPSIGANIATTISPRFRAKLVAQVRAELLKKGETITAAIERLRLRELRADQHRVRSAPFPSGIVKQEMRVQVAALADAAADPIDLSAEAPWQPRSGARPRPPSGTRGCGTRCSACGRP